MSQMPVMTAPRPTRSAAAARPDLRVVGGGGATRVATPPRRLPFALLCSALLAAGLVALLLINMSLAQGAYALHDLQSKSVALSQDEQRLAEDLAMVESPERLAQSARDIGMVPGNAPAFLDVSDGSVTGEPSAAPTPTPTKTPGAAAKSGPDGAPRSAPPAAATAAPGESAAASTQAPTPSATRGEATGAAPRSAAPSTTDSSKRN